MKQESTREEFLCLTTRGWKSALVHRIEIWFVEYEGRYYVVSEMGERSHWVQNIRRNPSVAFRVGKKPFTGSARSVDQEAEAKLAAAVRGLMDEKYRWSDGLIVELEPD